MNESKPTNGKKGGTNSLKEDFDAGRVVWSRRGAATTKRALRELDMKDVIDAFLRHLFQRFDSGRGDVCQEGWTTIEKGQSEGNRLFSVHQDHHGTRFWIVTELDSMELTILLPSEN